MLQETLNHLQHQNLLLGDRINHDAIADLCMPPLLAKPVASDSMDEINEKAIIVPELRHVVLGDVDAEDVERELDEVITKAVGATGKVQDKLENGYVLCAAQVSRTLSHNGGGSITVRRRGRFVTSDPDTIERYFWQPAASRLLTSMQAVRTRVELSMQRQPLLEARRPGLVAKAHEQIALELPMET